MRESDGSSAPSAGERFAAVPLELPGTPVADWAGATQNLPLLDLAGWERVVVVVAHPDDEVLGLGRLLALLAERAIAVEVLIASNGEGSHVDGEAAFRVRLAQTRRQESEAAATALGLPAPRFLGFPDGQLGEHEAAIAEAIAETVGVTPAGEIAVLAHWLLDGHPDHEAVGRAATTAVQHLRAARASIRLLSFPVWALHWDHPEGGLIPMERGLRVPSGPGHLDRKRQAATCFASQIGLWPQGGTTPPILPRHVVDRLIEGDEFVLTEDNADVREPVDSRAHLTELYERAADPWDLASSEYEARKRRATLDVLPRRHYHLCFEPGCSIGMLTLELAERAFRIEAWEPVARPYGQVRSRIETLEAIGAIEPGRVVVSQLALTSDPAGPQLGPMGADLIVLSEVLYYLPHAELEAVLSALVELAAPGAHIVAVHWRHPVAGWPGGGSETHSALHAQAGLVHLIRDDADADYLIDVFEVVGG